MFESLTPHQGIRQKARFSRPGFLHSEAARAGTVQTFWSAFHGNHCANVQRAVKLPARSTKVERSYRTHCLIRLPPNRCPSAC